MYELIKLGEHTYYIDSPNRIGVYDKGDGRACLIDSGNDGSAGKKALARLSESGLSLDSIFITHCHADHIGGCGVCQKRTGCEVFTPGGLEFAFAADTRLQSVYMGGCFPFAEYRSNKFYVAEQFEAKKVSEAELPEGLEKTDFFGHSMQMCAYKTCDEVWFVGDIVWGENIIEKYGMTYQYDIAAHLEALEKLCALEGKIFVPSHAQPTEDIRPLADKNRQKTLENAEFIYESCKNGIIFDDLMAKIFSRYSIQPSVTQYCFTGGIARSYLSYLCDRGKLAFESDVFGRLVWKSV